MSTLQKILLELQKKIEDLKEKRRSANSRKDELLQQISSLYAKPLNDRQVMQLMLSAVDERAKTYKTDVLNGGHLDAQKTQGRRPLSFDDFNTINGVERVRGGSEVYRDKQLLFKIELYKHYDMGTHTWMCFFFGELIKEKIADLYSSKYEKPKFDAFETIEERSKAIHQLHEEVMQLESEISAIDNEIDEISGPAKNFMRSV